MARREENLKKINDGLEKLSDEQLEQIVGGIYRNVWADFHFLQDKLHIMNYHGALWESETAVNAGWAKVGITCVTGKGDPDWAESHYFLNGKEISRDEACSIARKWADNYNPVLDAVENVLHNNPAFKL